MIPNTDGDLTIAPTAHHVKIKSEMSWSVPTNSVSAIAEVVVASEIDIWSQCGWRPNDLTITHRVKIKSEIWIKRRKIVSNQCSTSWKINWLVIDQSPVSAETHRQNWPAKSWTCQIFCMMEKINNQATATTIPVWKAPIDETILLSHSCCTHQQIRHFWEQESLMKSYLQKNLSWER